jgi:hypothetical protein
MTAAPRLRQQYSSSCPARYRAELTRQPAVELLESLVKGARSAEDVLLAKIKLAQAQFSRKNFDITESLVSDILRKDSQRTNLARCRARLGDSPLGPPGRTDKFEPLTGSRKWSSEPADDGGPRRLSWIG